MTTQSQKRHDKLMAKLINDKAEQKVALIKTEVVQQNRSESVSERLLSQKNAEQR